MLPKDGKSFTTKIIAQSIKEKNTKINKIVLNWSLLKRLKEHDPIIRRITDWMINVKKAEEKIFVFHESAKKQ